MEESIEDLYFHWLCSKVEYYEHPTPSLTHWNLLRALHSIEFVYLLSGDDNRAEDGVELRMEFLFATGYQGPPEWENMPCSFLEMLVAFAKRAEWMTLLSSREWVWIMLSNLGLSELNDATPIEPAALSETLDICLWRTYEPSGEGGLFPLERPARDQKSTELWYQLCDYLIDQNIE